ncbi:MAG TPA: cytochrome c maturation protein CcmE [Coriobacteriia bacterium]|nr:cytochrome c maturation protein CcmE [Coriobacteriia bacterium]
MNKRARTRLIGVTAIILIVVAAIFLAGGNKTAAYYKTVAEISKETDLVGERVKVGGAVVAASWDKKSNPMTFTIRDEKDEAGTGPTVKVVYQGAVPSTFGDGVVAIVTGDLGSDGTIAADEMITKCPSKYQSAEGAMPVADVKDGVAIEKVSLAGFVKAGTIAPPGGDARFVIAETADGSGVSVTVKYEGALPSGMTDGSSVVLTGKLNADKTFDATDVAISK